MDQAYTTLWTQRTCRTLRHYGQEGTRLGLLFGGPHTSEPSFRLAALDRITCPAIAVVEFVVGQMGFEMDASWHAPVLQLHAATPYHAGVFCSVAR